MESLHTNMFLIFTDLSALEQTQVVSSSPSYVKNIDDLSLVLDEKNSIYT